MIAERETAAVVGVGAVACAACCAGPIVGFVVSLGLGTLAALASFGVVGVLVALVGLAWLPRRGRRRPAGEPIGPVTATVEAPTKRTT